MDGNKKIRTLLYSVGLIVCMTACSVKSTSYTGLYVDRFSSSDSLKGKDKIESKEEISEKLQLTDSTLNSSFEKISKSSDRDKKLIYNNKSSLTDKSDKTPVKSKQEDSTGKTNLEDQNRNFKALERELNKDQKSVFGTDSASTLTKAQKLQIVSGHKKSKKDSVEEANTSSSQNQPQKRDTVFINEKEVIKDEKNEKADSETKKLQKRIEQLESREYSLQEREPIYIEKEIPVREVERIKDKIVESYTNEVIKTDANDKQYILLPSLGNQQKKDTVYVKKEVTVKDTVVVENESDKVLSIKLNSQNDTISQLKNLIRQKELQQQNIDSIYKTKEIDKLQFTAFYEIGRTIPSNDILEELKEKIQSRPVEKIMLSGYTDASGNQSINKALTDKRLDYIKDIISKFVSIHKIYLQNFGNRFASEEVISTERRVEIKIYIKPENELKSKKNKI